MQMEAWVHRELLYVQRLASDFHLLLVVQTGSSMTEVTNEGITAYNAQRVGHGIQ